MKTSAAKWAHSWLLVHKDRSIAYTMYAKTDELKTLWMIAIQDAL